MGGKVCLIVLCSLSFTSCFLSKKNRADRKIKKAMRLDPKRFATDTVTIHDTIVVESFRIDTIKEIVNHDTVTVINNDRVHLKYFYDTTRLEIWHEVECKGDTVYIENDVVVDKVIESPISINWIAIALGVVIIFVFAKNKLYLK